MFIDQSLVVTVRGLLSRGLIGLLILAAAAGCAGRSGAGESVYRSAEGRFRILLPADREESTEVVPTVVGELETHSVTVHPGPGQTFGVFYTDIPESTGEIDVAGSFDRAIANTIAADPALAVTYRNRTFAYGGPALDYTLEGGGAKVWARIAIVGRRIYLIQLTGPPGRATEATYARYIDTFELVDPEEAVPEDEGFFSF